MSDIETQGAGVPGDEGLVGPGPQADDDQPSVMAENSYGLTQEEQVLATLQDDPAGGELGSMIETDNPVGVGDTSSPEALNDDGDAFPDMSLVATESRYAFVVLAAKRAKQLREGAKPFVQGSSPNVLTVAMQEAAQEKIRFRLAEEGKKPVED
ncbi:MAG: DNA-directed RNA polymerase subunit omega [Armatimonadota bacterium]